MAEVRLKLSPPWVTYVNKIKALFEPDPDIKIVVKDNLDVRLYVDNERKASAIDRLLPKEKEIGNLRLDISIIPANGKYSEGLGIITDKELFDIAFDRNPVYAYTKEVSGLYNNKMTYVVFKNKVVQFFNDNLNDIHGLISTLYEDIADELFEDAYLQGVFFNTDIEEKVGMPLGEWP